MSDREELLLVLGLIYLAECFRWVRRGGVVFRRWLGPRWFRLDHSEFMANEHGDLHWTWPVPGFGEFLVARGLPWSLGPAGVATWQPASCHPQGRAAQVPNFRRWEELGRVEVESQKIIVSAQPWWLADTPAEAARLGALLRRLVCLEPSARGAAIRAELTASFDVRSIQDLLQKTESELRTLSAPTAGLWSLLFVLGPAVIWRFGWLPALPIVLGSAYALSGWIARQSVRRHRAWYPDLRDERFKLGLLAALSPVTAMRAMDLIGRSRLEKFEPLAVAVALLPTESAAVCAAVWARDAQFPRLPENPFPTGTPAAETVAWWAQVYRATGEAALERAGLNRGLGRQPPAPTEPTHTQYCARCGAQFQVVARTCQACGGRPLFPLPQSASLP